MNSEVHRDLIGRPVADLPTPALLIDAALLERNLAALRECMGAGTAAYRPHTKSHKSPLIAKMQIAHGARGVCCSKLGEAEVMAAGGVDDIHITTPVVGSDKARRLAQLAAQGRVSVVVDNADNAAELSVAATALGAVIDVLIEMDVGQGRCGVAGPEQALAVADAIGRAQGLRLKGMQGYQGKLQSMIAFNARRDAVHSALDKLMQGAQALKDHGFPVEALTGGGTGSLAIDLEFGGLTELQPGSYVFMDSTYRRIDWNTKAARTPFANSLSVLAGVVSRPLAGRAVLDVGWKAASSDSGPPVLKSDGSPVEFAGDEHSLVTGAAASALKAGSKLELIPSHCDTTVNLYDRYHVIRNGIVEAVWPVAARGRSD
jgi:D-serine deaminase-like pyridoxal phosphate-dependent protein